MGFSEKTVMLKLTAAIVLEGEIARAGTLVEMVENEAKDLLRRGKAVLAGEQPERDEGADADASAAAAAAAAEAAQGDAEQKPQTSKKRGAQ